jgi:hypothetical protein
VPLGLPEQGILVLAPEPAPEEGRTHALLVMIAPRVVDVFPRRIRLTQQVEQGVILVVLHDAHEGVTRRETQDSGHLPRGLPGGRAFLIIRRVFVGAGGALCATGWEGDHVVWRLALFTFTFT